MPSEFRHGLNNFLIPVRYNQYSGNIRQTRLRCADPLLLPAAPIFCHPHVIVQGKGICICWLGKCLESIKNVTREIGCVNPRNYFLQRRGGSTDMPHKPKPCVSSYIIRGL